jgi:hypothetical protein
MAEFVKLIDDAGNTVSQAPKVRNLLVPLTDRQEGPHIRIVDGQPVKGLGKVSTPQPN